MSVWLLKEKFGEKREREAEQREHGMGYGMIACSDCRSPPSVVVVVSLPTSFSFPFFSLSPLLPALSICPLSCS